MNYERVLGGTELLLSSKSTAMHGLLFMNSKWKTYVVDSCPTRVYVDSITLLTYYFFIFVKNNSISVTAFPTPLLGNREI